MDAAAEEFVSSPQDVIEVLRTRGGCQWVAVADEPSEDHIPAPSYLREAVKGPLFKLETTLPVTYVNRAGTEKVDIHIYRFLAPVETVDVVDMPIFSLGQGNSYKTKPIER
jgi:hypothetical protein